MFDAGNAALRCFGINEDVYACPICAQCFGRESIADKYLSVEHVPPRSAGGKPLLLTCKRCNNFAGHSYDYAIVEEEKLGRLSLAIGGQASAEAWNVRVDLGGHSLPGRLARTAMGLEFHLNDFKGGATQSFQNVFSGKAADNSFIVTYKSKFSLKKKHLADLKSAFLLVGGLFGYSYLLNENLREVREQLQKPKLDIFETAYGSMVIPAGKILLDEENGIVVASVHGRVIVLPWLHTSTRKFVDLVNLKRTIGVNAAVFDVPKSFDAIWDHRLASSFTMRREDTVAKML